MFIEVSAALARLRQCPLELFGIVWPPGICVAMPSCYLQSEHYPVSRRLRHHGGGNERWRAGSGEFCHQRQQPRPASLPVSNRQTIDLGTFGGTYYQSQGNAINDSGQVTGAAYSSAGYEHAFLYGDGQLADLGTLGGNSSEGEAINASGQVAGDASTTGNARDDAFLYSNGHMTDLGTLGGTASYSSAINASGQVTGNAEITGNAAPHAFLYSNGKMSDLGTLGGTNSQGYAINASGQVTGFSYTSASTGYHAFLYTNGHMNDLGTLGGTTSQGDAINSSGQVTGFAYTSAGYAHAILYSNGQMTDLGTLGGTDSLGDAINSSGQVVGFADTASNVEHAFLYSNGSMVDLNSLIATGTGTGVTLQGADGINDAGDIFGNGYNNNTGAYIGYVLTPVAVPEPTALSLLAFGCLSLARRSAKRLPGNEGISQVVKPLGAT